jgi:hypothetical protein
MSCCLAAIPDRALCKLDGSPRFTCCGTTSASAGVPSQTIGHVSPLLFLLYFKGKPNQMTNIRLILLAVNHNGFVAITTMYSFKIDLFNPNLTVVDSSTTLQTRPFPESFLIWMNASFMDGLQQLPSTEWLFGEIGRPSDAFWGWAFTYSVSVFKQNTKSSFEMEVQLKQEHMEGDVMSKVEWFLWYSEPFARIWPWT